MKVFKSSILLFTILLFCTSSNAQKGHHLEFEIKNYASKEVIVFYYLGDKQYIKDTLVSTKPGYFLAKGKETLKPGMYGIFNTSTKIKFDFLVNQGEQHFKLTTDAKNIISSMQVVGSDENSRFYDYLNFISDQRIKFNNTTNLLEELQQNKEANRGKIEELERKKNNINKTVTQYQKEIIDTYPNSFTSGIIKANTPVHVPTEVRKDRDKSFYYYKEHFFDNIDVTDDRLLRSPLLISKIDSYISDKLTVQHPDSIIISVDRVLKLSKGNHEIYQNILARLLNKYAKSKIVCLDAVYVHLVDQYYSKGKANWLEKEQLVKIQASADALRPILCNSIAPEISIQTVNDPNQKKSLHKINSKYTVLFMWNYDADIVAELMPDMIKFYDVFKSQGVALFSICTKSNNLDKAELLGFIDEHDMNRWQNLVDWDNQSNFMSDYNVSTDISIFLLDENKKIIAKRIGIDQITNVMNKILKND